MRRAVPALLLALLVLCSAAPWALAQVPVAAPAAPAPGAAAPGAAGAPGAAAAQPTPAPLARDATFVRLIFLTLDEQTFNIHPYFQITGDPAYSNGMAGSGGTTYFGSPASDKNAGALAVALHSLPPFGIEYGRSLDLFLPKGISIGYDFFYIPQTAAGVAKSGTVLPISTDTFLYNFSARLYAFDPAKAGLNYYLGLGLGVLEGTLTAQPFVGQPPQYINYSDTQIGFTVLGLETKGAHWGGRYELWVINAANTRLDSNPYPQPPSTGQTSLDLSGSIIRIALFYQF